jgi:hypothetical protein
LYAEILPLTGSCLPPKYHSAFTPVDAEILIFFHSSIDTFLRMRMFLRKNAHKRVSGTLLSSASFFDRERHREFQLFAANIVTYR